MCLPMRLGIVIALCALLFTGCSGGGGLAPRYEITTEVLGEGNIHHPDGSFSQGTRVDIQAEAATGWRFLRWEGEVAEPNNEETRLVVDRNHRVTAIFVETNPDHGFAGWEGTPERPYMLQTKEHLQNLRNVTDPDAQAANMAETVHFILVDDIDLGSIDNWQPIGTMDWHGDTNEPIFRGFTGIIEGRGHAITNLTIDRPDENHIGLFGLIEKGEIRNLHLTNVNVQGQRVVGAIAGRAGRNDDGQITNVTITNSSATGTIGGKNVLGGLVGAYSAGQMEYSEAAVEVSGEYFVGGLIGSLREEAALLESGATGDIVGKENVGGLVGYTLGTISSSWAFGDVLGERHVGGLVGVVAETGAIIDSSASGVVTATGVADHNQADAGGLVGGLYDQGEIHRSQATGAVSSPGQDHVGGLVGQSAATSQVVDSSATGRVTGGSWVGGLVGAQEGHVSGSFAEGMVEGENHVGGLVGSMDSLAVLVDSTATGNVFGDEVVGGLVGYSEGTLRRNSATGDVEAVDSIGGLVGINRGTIEQCFATGAITGDRQAGGLVGVNNAQPQMELHPVIRDSYARGAVTVTNERAGGLVGIADGEIHQCYATGQVAGPAFTGGLVGDAGTLEVTHSYYDLETTGQEDNDLGTPHTSAEMRQQITFVDWDFVTVWSIEDGQGYPSLQWE